MRATTLTPLVLIGFLAACGGAPDGSDDMMDDGAGMMQDSPRMDDAMGAGAMDGPGMGADSPMDDMMDDDSAMARDTSEMRRP